ncbi:MAG: thioredoxin domain-containing protein [Aggregatilineales bacterium]
MTQKTKRKNDQNQQVVIALVVGAIALIAVGLVIVFGGNAAPGDAISIDYSEIPQGRTADGGYILGSEDAPVTIVAFEDFLCGHCQGYQGTVKEFIKKYVATGQARFEFRMLPTNSVSPQAMAMAQCADEVEPNSFWEAHDILFRLASSERYSNASNRTFADEIGIPYADLLECAPDATQQDIDTALAREAGATGTPTIMVRMNDRSMPVVNPILGQSPGIEQFDRFFASLAIGG